MKKRSNIINNIINNFKLKNYKIISKSGKVKKITPLGEGGSGIVYLVEQQFTPKAKVKRAIKFFVFRDDLQKTLQTSISSENFEDEIVNISLFNHENIIKVIDGGISTDNNNLSVPYIITDYVEGCTLQDLMVNDSNIMKYFNDNKEKIFDLFLQMLKGLCYLHKRNFYHCDIAPKNIFIKLLDDEDWQVIIGDLGVGHTLDKDIISPNKTKVIGTENYMPENVKQLKNTFVSSEDFKKLQPAWDIFATIKIFNECIKKVFNLNDEDRSEFSWLNAMRSILRKDITSLDYLNNELIRIQPVNRTIAGLPELSESDSGSHRQLLPIKNVLRTNRTREIMEHPMMIRLKQVPQLLMGSSIFPGSNHTRYEHALGTYENMRYILTQLLKKEQFIALFDKKSLEYALLASLLANITRFPFSFAIHEIKNNDDEKFKKINQKNIFSKVIDYIEPNTSFGSSLRVVLRKEFDIDDREIDLIKNITCNINCGLDSPNIQYISSLINSTIDVRVLDFLKRDAFHLGMQLGIQFDFDNLINFLDIYNNHVAIKSQGVSYVEQVVTSRYWMFKNIYWNKPNRAYTVMLKQIFGTLDSDSFQDLLIDNMLFSTPQEVLACIENYKEVDDSIKNLISLITAKRPRIFKQVFIINKSEEDAIFSIICNKISKMKFSQLDELRKEIESEISVSPKLNKNKINILIDMPVDNNKKLGEDINVIKYNGAIEQLRNMSGIVSGILNYFDTHLQWLRIYVHPDYRDGKIIFEEKEMGKTIKKILIRRLG
jgi:HD superfamily phosphohydrolase